MRKIKIAADSSANLTDINNISFASAPLKIITSEKEFTDDGLLDIDAMVEYFSAYKGKSQTSCPNPSDWLEAFGDADDVFCVTITGNLSGAHNSACVAKQIFEGSGEGRRVCVIDSLSTGSEMELIIEKLAELINEGKDYDEICRTISSYQKKTGLLFILESIRNLAANGRVFPAVAKIAGILGIRVVGKASDVGTLEPMNKCRGEKKALETIFSHLKELGFAGGKIRISHVGNEDAAHKLKDAVLSAFPSANILIRKCRGLCSYYAEKGGLLVGFEKA